MTYLRFAEPLNLYDITTEPTERHAEQNVTVANDTVIIVSSIGTFCLFFLIYFFCRNKKREIC
jgi:hypothetical protein